ncbi:MAG: glycosyl hydrolase [Flavobacteriales bacterium]|nr:glycosyl hydrolase [Flavobacteriales bacterium]
MKRATLLLSIFFALSTTISFAQKKKDDAPKGKHKSGTFSGLAFRSIGPAFTSGRIADLAVNPNNTSEYYVAVASGGVWKTTNAGTTYLPIFDGQGSYSIGCITIDPSNEHVIWVGSGENNNQRSVAYGDGIYKSEDGGKSWKNKGLKTSEHIGKIIVDPRNSNVVYVAAMGPLWKKGGERGLYKSTDGGETWKRILHIDAYTGITDIVIDPRNPDVIYAAAEQRMRHVFTYIGGGPGSGIHKSTDGGLTWKKLKSGLPSVDVGRIGLAISPVNPDYVFAIIEASDKKGGFFRSTNRGASWKKMSGYSTSGNYYQEIICDPNDVNKIFSMNTWLHHTEDGGKTFKPTGEKNKHVDNHCIWIDPTNTNHWRVGCDGGIYETWDHASNWEYKANLPVTQFYKVAVDNTEPFYFVYGGTQDNNTQGGPSRTTNSSGIVNSDWYITLGGDGFEAAIDPVDPNIVYSQAQYGWLARYDKKSGEKLGIKPQPGKGEPALRWNWDAPLLISPHKNTRLYFAANKLFRSEDRGNSWTAVSPDLTRQIDRNTLPVMGQVWSMDAVMKNKSTTVYGNIVAFDESPKQEGLLYVGTDDGLLQVSDNGGSNWIKYDKFPGVPETTYVNDIVTSQHEANTVYVAFNNHKRGDFKPYILKSTDKGKSWTAIQGNLPKRGSVYAIAEDHVNPKLLFAGTEFGLYFSLDGGVDWTKLGAGLPTIAVRDIEIQKRENDLVLASFGRGFYILDDYTPLRTYKKDIAAKGSHIFPVKDALMYVDSRPLGLRGKGSQGASFYTADNPPLGATFTYMIKDTLRTLKEERQRREKKLIKAGEKVPYPSFEMMRSEDTEEKPYLIFTIKDEKGNEVRKIKTDASTGIKRVTWDFRYSDMSAIKLKTEETSRYGENSSGPIALPGNYTVSIAKSENGVITPLGDPVAFKCKTLNNTSLPAKDKAALLAFQRELDDFRRVLITAGESKADADKKIKHIKIAVQATPNLPMELMKQVKAVEKQLGEIQIKLYGDRSLARRDFETYPSINDRVSGAMWSMWRATSAPTQTNMDALKIAREEYEPVKALLKQAIATVVELEAEMDKYKAPYTPGRKLEKQF